MRQHLNVIRRLFKHEWEALAGHRHALLEQLAVAGRAQTLSQLINDQIDLVPESRRRLQRNAEARRAILVELGAALRQTVQERRLRKTA